MPDVVSGSGRWRAFLTALSVCAAPLLLFTSSSIGEEQGVDEQRHVEAHYSDAGAETCLSCHNSPAMLDIFRTAHGMRADPDSPMASEQCESCHGAGGEHSNPRKTGSKEDTILAFGLDASTAMHEQDAVCTNCHETDVSMAWVGSEHAQSEIGCGGCHNVHAAVDAVGTHAGQNGVCYDCHREQKADSQKPFAHPLRTDSPVRVAAMVCTDCHNPHASVASGLLARNTTNEVCFECHAEFRGPVVFDHAPVSEDCGNCHEPHGSIHPGMLSQRGPLLCQSCHSQSGHPSVSFTSRGLPGGQGRPSSFTVGQNCMNCHTQVHGSNHPSGFNLMR